MSNRFEEVTPDSLRLHADYFDERAREGEDTEIGMSTPSAILMRTWANDLEVEQAERQRTIEVGRLIYETLQLGPPPSDEQFLRDLGLRLRTTTTAAIAERASLGGAW